MNRKRILLIIPEMMVGGAQRSLSKLSLEFAKDHDTWLVIFNRGDAVAYPFGGELVSLDVAGSNSLFTKARSFFQRIRALKNIKKKLRIDISISFLEGADYVNVLSRISEKVILSVRGSKRYDENIKGRFSWLRNKILIPWLYRKADRIVSVNHGIATELRTYYRLGSSRIDVIGNFYNSEEISNQAQEPKDEKLERLYKNRILITSGRLAREKGLRKLIEVFGKLKAEAIDLRLVLVGDGPEKKELITLANALNLRVSTGPDFDETADVLILGNQINVYKFLHGATLYLMNSSSEGFPNGLAEAMICGVPVVAADCPYGPREILEPNILFPASLPKPHLSQFGILMPMLVTESDITMWTDTLRDILSKEDKRLQLAEGARERIGLFDPPSMIAKWYEIFEDSSGH